MSWIVSFSTTSFTSSKTNAWSIACE